MSALVSYVIPTRDRVQRLRATLAALASIDHAPFGGASVVVVDNAGSERPILPAHLPGGLRVTEVRLDRNMGAAARNIGAMHPAADAEWVVMLDDDSYPLSSRHLTLLRDMPADVGAVSADIFLPDADGRQVRESGGLPEVFIGCGAALRRSAFLALGGYDHAFGYYAEEYDLSARLLLSGARITFEPAFRVRHEKVSTGRDMNVILGRLIRNNGWVVQRYAPEGASLPWLRETRARYRAIARKESALRGFSEGLRELRGTLRTQPRQAMPQDLWDRFTGLAAARSALQAAFARAPFRSAALIEPGKNAGVVCEALRELGVRLTDDGEESEALVIGTLSPGPMLDAFERLRRLQRPHGPRVLAPWIPLSAVAPVKGVLAPPSGRRPRAAA